MPLLEDKVVAITGAGRGIGRGVAIMMAQEGAKVVVNDPGVGPDGVGTNAGLADEVVAEIKAAGGTAIANHDTVATADGGEGIVKTALDTYGRIDILVNNAGILRDRMIFNMSEEEWDAVIAVHLKGHFNTTKPAATVMRQQRYGRIINFTSESARQPVAGGEIRRAARRARRAGGGAQHCRGGDHDEAGAGGGELDQRGGRAFFPGADGLGGFCRCFAAGRGPCRDRPPGPAVRR